MKTVWMLLCLLPSFGWAAAPAATEKVKFKTADGQTLVGLYLPAKGGNPTVVMLHGLSAQKEEWTPLINALEAEGWGILAYDQRGHGQSSLTKSPEGYPNGFQYFGAPGPGSQWEKMIDDVGAAVRFLAAEKKVDRKRVALAGASIGANIVLNFAVLSRPPLAVVMLSPGLNYQNITTESALPKAKCPILIVASPADGYSFKSSRQLAGLNPQASFWSDVKAGHGVQMFDDNLLKRIVSWLKSKNIK